MVRRYEEPIEVRALSSGRVEGDRWAVGTPDAFIWRGRLYVVHEVLDHWQERRAWWRDALDGTDVDDVGGRTVDDERQVWRVAASPGRMASSGTYDLGSDGAPDRWLLLRAHD
jgi:hypothetical protein